MSPPNAKRPPERGAAESDSSPRDRRKASVPAIGDTVGLPIGRREWRVSWWRSGWSSTTSAKSKRFISERRARWLLEALLEDGANVALSVRSVGPWVDAESGEVVR